jgi:hypothetical protein
MNRVTARRTVVVALAASVVTACGARSAARTAIGTDTGTASADLLPSGVDARVLDRWQAFPVTRRPRPLVLLDEALHGFDSDAAKLAALSGNVVLATTAPGVTDAVVRLPDGPARLRLLGAQPALTAGARGTRPAEPSAAPLPITRAVLGTESFGTDRGRVDLPAWLFTVASGPGQIACLALPDSAFWRPGTSGMTAGLTAALTAGPPTALTATASGRVIAALFDAPPDACPSEPTYRYEATYATSATAVAVALRGPGSKRDNSPNISPGPSTASRFSRPSPEARPSLTLPEMIT